MSKFITNANLPSKKVTSLICGGLNSEIIDYLESRNIEILYTENNEFVDVSISNHCDISALYLGGGRIVVDRQQKSIIDSLKEKGLEVIVSEKDVKGEYPDDVILNHAIVGQYIIGKSSNFDRSVKENLCELKIIDTKQGYSKCSVLVVDDNSIITDDISIAEKARNFGVNCLLITKGDILLDGHEYGFIGGASGKISENEIIFFGDITKHRDYIRIKGFLDIRNISIISFSFPLTDFGGIIPIFEME